MKHLAGAKMLHFFVLMGMSIIAESWLPFVNHRCNG